MAILALRTNGAKYILEIDADPSTGGGLNAPIGTIACLNLAGVGMFFLKTGAPNTSWTRIGDGSAVWGSITGSLSAQTDLSTALGLKADLVGGLVPLAQLPSITITDTFVVASQAAMLGLTTAHQGDVAVRTDLNKTFILTADPYSTLANWQELLTPPNTILSVNGQTGTVVLTTSDIAQGTNLYFTEAQVRATLLTGVVFTDPSAVVATDSILVGMGKLQAEITAGTGSLVTSVNTKTGAVVLTTTDIAQGTNLYFTEAQVRATLLTGVVFTDSSAILATDSVLIALGKLQAEITSGAGSYVTSVNGSTGAVVLTTSDIAQGTNLYFTEAQVRSTLLTGIVFTDPSAVVATDSILVGMGKLQAEITSGAGSLVTSVNTKTGAVVLTTTDIAQGTNLYFTDALVRSALLTGIVFTSSSAVLATDSILVAIGKLQAEITSGSGAVNLTGPVTSVGAATAIANGALTTTMLSVSSGSIVYGDPTGFGGVDSALTFNDTTKTLSTTHIIATADEVIGGNTINANAVLDVQSTTKAFMPPRMTNTQMLAIASPTAGMVVYNTDFTALATYNGSIWTYGFANLNLDNVYSAIITTTSGAVTNSNKGSWITCTAANPTVCTFVSGTFTVTPNCVVSPASHNTGLGDPIVQSYSTNSTGLSIETTSSTTSSGLASIPVTISCQKSGADYLSSSSSVYSQAATSTLALATNFSAQVSSSGVVSGENLDWINGNCTNANPTVCTFNSSIFTVAPNCVATSSNTSAVLAITTPLTSTSTTVTVQQNSTITATQEPFTIHCQKSGADYTAAAKPFIVGSFAGYTNVPGYNGNVDTFSVSFGATATTVCSSANGVSCPYVDSIGTVANVTHGASGGLYNLVLSKTYLKLKCISQSLSSALASAKFIEVVSCNNCSSTIINSISTSFTSSDAYGTIMCQGIY